MVRQHVESGAAVTVAALRVPIEQADQFGVIETAADGRTITAFREKPKRRRRAARRARQVYASMGNYVFSTDTLVDAVTLDAAGARVRARHGRQHHPDAGRARAAAQVYDFTTNEVPGATDRDRGYWRDVGTLDAFYDAHMDLISVHPVFNLYNLRWPILTMPEPLPPAKFVFADEDRVGRALDSMVCSGVIISGGSVERSVLSPSVQVHSYAEVTGSVLFSGRRRGPRRGDPQRDPRQGRGGRARRDGRRRPRGRPRALDGIGRPAWSWSPRAPGDRRPRAATERCASRC